MRVALHVGDLVTRLARAIDRELHGRVHTIALLGADERHVHLAVVIDHASAAERRHVIDLARDAEIVSGLVVGIAILDREAWELCGARGVPVR